MTGTLRPSYLIKTLTLPVVCVLLASTPSRLLSETDNEPHDFKAVDAIMQKAVDRGNIPGAVVLVGHNGKVVYRKAFGSRSLEPTREPMTVDTIFDLASLTKCIATATSADEVDRTGPHPSQRSRLRLPARVRAERQSRHHRPRVDDPLLRPALPISI